MEWHDIRDPADPKLDDLAVRYGLHPLHIEDCRHRNQSAKVEAQNGYLFVVLKPLKFTEDYCLNDGDIDFFIGRDFLIVVQEIDCGALCDPGARLQLANEPLRPDQLFYRLMDGLVDSYPPILDRMSERIDEMEDEALTSPEPKLLQDIFEIRRALIALRRVLSNTRDVVSQLHRNDYLVIGRDLMPFMRDVYDHTVRSLDQVEMERDLLTSTIELYLSSVANRTNQVMKALTVFGALATPALIITGIYGMNLQHLPFVEHPDAPIIVTSMILGVSGLLMLFLRWFRWL